MACQTIAAGTGFGNLCLSWVQTRLGLPHEGATASDAFGLYSARGAATSNPQPNDMVFFGPAPINGNAGHVGIVQGGGSFDSVLSDGSEYSCDIATFAAQNAPVSGYISTSKLGGHGSALSVLSPLPMGSGLAWALVGLGLLWAYENA